MTQPETESAAKALIVDAQTVRVVSAFRNVGIEPILLKGPAIANLLYASDSRTYVDTDLLIDPADQALAAETLAELGYRQPPTGAVPWAPSTTWFRGTHGPEVDLHTSIWRWAPADSLWAVLQAKTKTLRVGNIELPVMDDAAQCVHIVTHALQHQLSESGPNEDLSRALALIPDSTWQRAVRVSEEVGAADAFLAGLLASPEGRALAGRVGIDRATAPELDLELALAGTLWSGALQFENLAQAQGVRARLAVIHDRLFPPLDYARMQLDRGDKTWPWVIYLLWWWRLCRKTPAALAAWVRARRAVDARRNRNPLGGRVNRA